MAWIPLSALGSLVAVMATTVLGGAAGMSADTPEELAAATGLSNWVLSIARLRCILAIGSWIGASLLAMRGDTRWPLPTMLSTMASVGVASTLWF